MKSLKYGISAASVLCVAALSAHAVEWSLTVEKDGATNVVTAADGRKYAIDVSFAEKGGAWSGCVVNREKGAVVLGFEVMSGPRDVVEGKSALYLPHIYGRRIRNWPSHGVRQPGAQMWRETEKGVFVPAMSKWDASRKRDRSPSFRH